jgi:hypothetical protein
MVGFAMRHVPRARPSKHQHRFLEMLRDLGPRSNAETTAVRFSVKRACQVRGWVEWTSRADFPDIRAWHLTLVGRKALNRSARPAGIRNLARLPIDL